MAGGAVNDRLNTLYVGLPSSVGATVGVGDLNAERDTLTAKTALCQLLHLQSLQKSPMRGSSTQTTYIIAKFFRKSKRKIGKFLFFSRFRTAGMGAKNISIFLQKMACNFRRYGVYLVHVPIVPQNSGLILAAA